LSVIALSIREMLLTILSNVIGDVRGCLIYKASIYTDICLKSFHAVDTYKKGNI
jgi:hypothetical protein